MRHMSWRRFKIFVTHYAATAYNACNLAISFNTLDAAPRDFGWLPTRLSSWASALKAIPLASIGFFELMMGIQIQKSYADYIKEAFQLKNTAQEQTPLLPTHRSRLNARCAKFWAADNILATTFKTFSNFVAFCAVFFPYLGWWGAIPAGICSVPYWFVQLAVYNKNFFDKCHFPKAFSHKGVLPVVASSMYSVLSAALYFNSLDGLPKHIELVSDDATQTKAIWAYIYNALNGASAINLIANTTIKYGEFCFVLFSGKNENQEKPCYLRRPYPKFGKVWTALYKTTATVSSFFAALYALLRNSDLAILSAGTISGSLSLVFLIGNVVAYYAVLRDKPKLSALPVSSDEPSPPALPPLLTNPSNDDEPIDSPRPNTFSA